ncbi:MAG: zinc dependent phospholipase C family protein [Chryseolinea sp.]
MTSIIIAFWGFFAHQMINRLAVFILPPEMIGFYKLNIDYIREVAVNPDRRRFSMPEEAPRHYLDVDHYGDSALSLLPKGWQAAVDKYSEDTLKSYGIVPWHINRMYYQLREAFLLRDPARILKVSSEMGHYIGDAHVPLHTTENYNGQLTGQDGIHGFWESRLPEMFWGEFNFLVGKSEYIESPQDAAWNAVKLSHAAVDSVLYEERQLSLRMGEQKFSFETKGRQTIKVYSRDYSTAYYHLMDGMVERRMRAAIKLTGSLWYTAWVDAGQPNLKELIGYKPTENELVIRRKEIDDWKAETLKSRNSKSKTHDHTAEEALEVNEWSNDSTQQNNE